tara:strand:+ start:65127 stop:65660 length:534 start_codon:yes stop_codon:yes gene_type:complete
VNVYQVNTKSILLNLWFSCIIVSGFLIYVNFKEYTFSDVLFGSIIIAAQVLLSLFLLVDYLIHKTSGVFHFHKDTIELQIKNSLKIIRSEEISKVVIYGSPAVYKKENVFFLPFTCFHYAEIQLNDTSNLYVTSLSNYRLYQKLEKEPILQKKLYLKKGGWLKRGELFNSIWLNNLK